MEQCCTKRVPYTTCTYVKQCCTKKVPYTTCTYVRQTCTRRVPYTVCRRVCSTKMVTVSRCVPRKVCCVQTRCVPRVVCRKVPVTCCEPAKTCGEKKDCAKACADACEKAGVACDGKSVGLVARQLMARGDAIKGSWTDGAQAYASMCPEKKASLRTALAEQMKVDQKLALMPATIASLTEGLATVAAIDAKMKAYAEANPEAIKELPKEAIAAFTRGALVVAKASEVMAQVSETMQKAQSNGTKVAQN